MSKSTRLTGAVSLGLATMVLPGVVGAAGAAARGAHTAATGPIVLASGLDNPRHLSVGPDGALYITEAGVGGPGNGTTGGPACVHATNTLGEPAYQCIGTTGRIDRLVPGAAMTTALGGIESVITEPVAGGPGGPPAAAEVAGVSSVSFSGGALHFLVQAADLTAGGSNGFVDAGIGGTEIGKAMIAAPASAASSWAVAGDFPAYAAAHPQTAASLGGSPSESATDSDPYDITPYAGGYLVADAGANAVRQIPATAGGAVGQVTSFPFQAEIPVPGSEGPGTPTTPQPAQSVPTEVVAGPDGSLYVGELVGVPSDPGTARVWKVAPAAAPTLFATGFSSIADLAFTPSGQLLVLEYSAGGLLSRSPADGQLIEVGPTGVSTVLASGLDHPTGLAVTRAGAFVATGGDSGTASNGQILEIATTPSGYRIHGADGSVHGFGSEGVIPAVTVPAASRVVATTEDPVGAGYWAVTASGTVLPAGAAGFYGDATTLRAAAVHTNAVLASPVVGIAATPDGLGYWVAEANGGVLAFGDARGFGQLSDFALNAPVVGIAGTPDGGGYWLIARDGGVFSFGDATFHGSTGGIALAQPVVGGASTADGAGYWLVASDGGVFSFGDATFHGSTGGIRLAQPVAGLAPTSTGAGYWLVAQDGGVFTFGDALFAGSAAGASTAPVVGIG